MPRDNEGRTAAVEQIKGVPKKLIWMIGRQVGDKIQTLFREDGNAFAFNSEKEAHDHIAKEDLAKDGAIAFSVETNQTQH